MQAIDAAGFLCQRDVESPAQHGFTSACAASACSWPRAPQTGPWPLDSPVTERSTRRERHQRGSARCGPSYASSSTARDTHGVEHHSPGRRPPAVTTSNSHGLESDTTRLAATPDIDRTLCQLERCKRQLEVWQFRREPSEWLSVIISEWVRFLLDITRTGSGHRPYLSDIARRKRRWFGHAERSEQPAHAGPRGFIAGEGSPLGRRGP